MSSSSRTRNVFILRLTGAFGLVWTGYILCLPYMKYQGERFQGPPFITTSSSVSSALSKSATVTRIVNPENQPYIGDSRSVIISNLRDRKSGKVLSDAEILKRLCIGFWGGSVFSYEKAMLRAWKKDRVFFDRAHDQQGGGYGHQEVAPRTGTDRGDMFATFRPGRMNFVLEKGDTLDRAFQVLDIQIDPNPGNDDKNNALPGQPGDHFDDALQQQAQAQKQEQPPSSYIDFGFGSSQPGSQFAGVHRLSVTRLPPVQIEGQAGWSEQLQKEWLENSGGRVMITHESYVCSPSAGSSSWLLKSSWLKSFHENYAYALFSTGVAYVVRGWGRSKGS